MKNKLTQKQRLDKYQKHIDLVLENEIKKPLVYYPIRWFYRYDGFTNR